GETSGFRFMNTNSSTCQVITGYQVDALGNVKFPIDPATKQPCSPSLSATCTPLTNTALKQVAGFRLQDARASYGIGLETFLLGFPLHFDWTWRTLFNKDWEDVVFGCTSVSASGQCVSGADDFRKPRFAVWIGYDF